MSIQNFGSPLHNNGLNPHINSSKAAEIGSILFDINKKKVKVKKGSVKEMAKGLAEIAYSLGETNDTDSFAETMTEDIWLALEEVKKRKKKKKNN